MYRSNSGELVGRGNTMSWKYNVGASRRLERKGVRQEGMSHGCAQDKGHQSDTVYKIPGLRAPESIIIG